MQRAILTDGVNTVEFSVVESENPNYSNDITDNPVETGEEVSDHVNPKPISFSISGIIVGEDAGQKIAILRNFRNSGSLLKYVGRNSFLDVCIESLNTTHDAKIRNGFAFSITLKQVRITTKKTVDIISPGISAAQIKKTENKGKQQTKSINIDLEKEIELRKKAKNASGGQ